MHVIMHGVDRVSSTSPQMQPLAGSPADKHRPLCGTKKTLRQITYTHSTTGKDHYIITLFDFEQLDIKDKSRVRGNARQFGLTISKVWGTREATLTTNLHSLDTLVPACAHQLAILQATVIPARTFDDLAFTETEREWPSLGVGVENRAVLELANVSHAHPVARLGHRTRSSLLVFYNQARWKLHLRSRTKRQSAWTPTRLVPCLA